ncbi:MAG TPA: S8 family serine peptidase [Polyangiaceae bacterium]|nr:S8 family serine peptidase [Polyangiaceae bacterium]
MKRAAAASFRGLLPRGCLPVMALLASANACARGTGATLITPPAPSAAAAAPAGGAEGVEQGDLKHGDLEHGSPEQGDGAPDSVPALEGAVNRSLLTRLGVPQAWQHSRGAGVIVGVLDNGFYADDPIMAGAYLEPELKFENVVLRQDIPCAAHGSTVAATIAARGSGPGSIVGIAPAAQILRMSYGCPKWVELDLKQAPPGEQERLHLQYVHEIAVQGAHAFDWAVDHGAKIINFSATLFPPNYEQLPIAHRIANSDLQVLAAAAQRARAHGVLILAAAGNWIGIKTSADQPDWKSAYPQGGLYFPASSPAVVAVGCACGAPGRACEFFHTGAEIGQPQISSLRQGHHYGPGLAFVGYCDGVPGVIEQQQKFVYDLTQEGGTSNAAPEVAGVLALAWAASPDSSAEAMLDVLRRSSTDLGEPGYDERFGYGVPNARRAVELARSSSSKK